MDDYLCDHECDHKLWWGFSCVIFHFESPCVTVMVLQIAPQGVCIVLHFASSLLEIKMLFFRILVTWKIKNHCDHNCHNQCLHQHQNNNDNNNDDNDGNNNNNNNKNRHWRKTPDDATHPRPKTDKYCWTHRARDHLSQDCKRQAPGHKPTATFTNRMGGSNAHCTPVPTWKIEPDDSKNKLVNILLPSSSECSTQKITKHVIAKGDSGASNHCICLQDSHILNDVTLEHGPAVQQPDNSTLQSSGSGQLPMSDQLSTDTKKAIAPPNLKIRLWYH